METDTQVTHARDVQATKRKKGNPRNYFAPMLFSDLMALDEIHITDNDQSSPSREQNYGKSSVDIGEFISPSFQLYTVSEFLRRNLGVLRGVARKKGVANNDLGDVVDDSIVNFLDGEKVPMDKPVSRDYIEKYIKPTTLQYLDANVMVYHMNQHSHSSSAGIEARPDSLLSRPAYYVMLHLIGESPLRELDAEDDHPYESKEPVSGQFLLQDESTRAIKWLEEQIGDAIGNVSDISLHHLQDRYRDAGHSQIKHFAQTQGTSEEQRIADYVAFGTHALNADELLQSPLFYQAMHNVITTNTFMDEQEEYIEPATFASMARSARINNVMRRKSGRIDNMTRREAYAPRG